MKNGRARLDFQTPLLPAGGTAWDGFDRVVRADCLAEVVPALEAVDAACAEGAWAVGWVAFEAAPAFDPALRVRPGCPVPLVWFGLGSEPHEPGALPAPAMPDLDWTSRWTEVEYQTAFASIQRHIHEGDTYQANLTFPQSAPWTGDCLSAYAHLRAAQRAAWCAYIETPDLTVLSASPELFFERSAEQIRTRPMKGTRRRGLFVAQDRDLAADLQRSAKDRAENVMIVDMLRNDLGRIARPGSVHVPELFTVERYPTVWQMTSSVVGQLPDRLSLPELFRALFPCGSVTGAPKVKTMEILAGLEPEPRGIYCGAVGVVLPGGRCVFNVPIRTLTVQAGRARYCVGSGLVSDSDAAQEYAECRAKADVLSLRRPPFQLFETLLWTPQEGWTLLAEHLDRLLASADYFDFPATRSVLQVALDAAVQNWTEPMRVRLLLSAGGGISVEAKLLQGFHRPIHTVAWAACPIDSHNPFLYHKTTLRTVYEQVRAETPTGDDVLLHNERGELTESTIANVALELDGAWYTPPVSCGLLGGTQRRRLLANGELQERILTRDDLLRATGIHLFNSVRGRWPVQLLANGR